jgi:hypothetical protein
MILSPESVSVLQNFATINQSIILREGNVIRTMSPSETVFAKATVSDEFPCDAPLYDLSKFLGLLSLSKDDSDIEFGSSSLLIRQGRSKVKYAYCPENLIDAPPVGKDIKMRDIDVKFELPQDVWSQVTKAMSIMGFSEFAFVGEDGVLSVQALSTRNESSDTYSAELGSTDLTFKCVIDADKMKLIPGNYEVSVSKAGLAYFAGDIAEYWIAISTKSEFND